MKLHLKMGLLPRVLIAVVLGIALGLYMPLGLVRIFATFNAVFTQLLRFIIPFIIVGLLTPAIGEIGRQAGRLLALTVAIAYADTVCCGMIAYATGSALFPDMIAGVTGLSENITAQPEAVAPYFTCTIPPMFDVMSALVFSFMVGLCLAYGKMPTLMDIASEFRAVVGITISRVVIPLLPFYIFSIFLGMTYTGQTWRIVSVFAQVIVVIFALHILILLYQFCVAGLVSRKNPLKLLYNMLPAYMTALGTSSSAATIPVTLAQTVKNGVTQEVASFSVPLCATIHMSGSAMKITSCALAICLIEGIPYDFAHFLHFVIMLGIVMVAAPGIPGGAIMAALAPLSSILGFSAEHQALMIALYIAMDSFGTACNVTGDGAIAIIVDKLKVTNKQESHEKNRF